MVFSMNEWTVSGRVTYLKELTGDFAASIRIKGETKRKDHCYESDTLEIGCLLKHRAFEDAKKKGIRMNSFTTMSGHLETWNKTIHGKPTNKVMFVADYILDVI